MLRPVENGVIHAGTIPDPSNILPGIWPILPCVVKNGVHAYPSSILLDVFSKRIDRPVEDGEIHAGTMLDTRSFELPT